MKQAIKKSLCIVLTALMLLTAVPLSGFVGMEFGISAQAASETGRVELVTDWTVNPANNTIAVYVNFVDAVDLKSWDLVINYDPAIFAYKAYLNGKDAKQVMNNSTSNGYTMEFNDAWDADSFKFSGYFGEVLWSAEEFYADSDFSEGLECIVDSDNFQALVIYLTVVDAEKFAAENTAITITEADSSMTFAAAKAVSAKVESGVSDIPSTTYNDVTATLNDDYFSKDSKVYNHDLAKFCSLFTVIGYTKNKPTITEHLSDCGFSASDKFIEVNAKRDEVNYFIADKTITVNGQSKTLVFVACIGSHNDQWYSNFDPLSRQSIKDYADREEMAHTHHGFANAREYVYGKLEDYVIENKIDVSNSVVLLTGHSRGAATVNLLAAKLIDTAASIGLNANNVYAYGFATPNTTLTINGPSFNKYKSIINIVNPEDLVTKLLPAAWGYGRYGVTYTLPSKTNLTKSYYNTLKNNMQEVYGLLLDGATYHPYPDGEKNTYDLVSSLTNYVKNIDELYGSYGKLFKWQGDYVSIQNFITKTLCQYMASAKGSAEKTEAQYALLFTSIGIDRLKSDTIVVDFADYFVFYEGIGGFTGGMVSEQYFTEAHQAETYCAYIMSMTPGQVTTKKDTYKGSVNCPVDVEIYDKATGELVGRIVNNVVDEEVAAKDNSVVMSVEGDSKQFWLSSDGDYEVKLIGNDSGTMDYTLSEIDSDIGEVKRVNFFDVEITDGFTMTAELENESFVIEEHELVLNDGSAIEATEILNEEEITTYSIDITATEGGFASKSLTAKSGDYVSLSAVADEDWVFVGWFENDELISTESEIAFVAKSDRQISVQFIHDHTNSLVTVNQKDPTATENGYTGDVVCSVCGTEISKGKVIPATGDADKNCDHICHKDGFIGFIWKIVQFFWKLFGMNPVCECGAAHY